MRPANDAQIYPADVMDNDCDLSLLRLHERKRLTATEINTVDADAADADGRGDTDDRMESP